MPVPGIAVVCTARNAALTALRSSSATAQPSSVMLSRITRPHFWTSLLTKRRHRSGPPPHHVPTRYRDALANLGAYQVLRHGFAHLAHVLVRRAGAPEQRQPAQSLELGEALPREAPDAGQHGGVAERAAAAGLDVFADVDHAGHEQRDLPRQHVLQGRAGTAGGGMRQLEIAHPLHERAGEVGEAADA